MASDKIGVVLLNNEPAYIGTGKYASDVYFASREYSIMLNILQYRKYFDSFPYGLNELGLKSRILLSPSILNTVFPNLIYSKTYETIRKYRNEGALIHFCNHSLNPIESDPKMDIVTIHDLFVMKRINDIRKIKNLLFGKYTKKFMKFRNIIVPSVVTKTSLEEAGCQSQIEVIPNPISPAFKPLGKKPILRTMLKLPQDSVLVLSIGSDTTQKNLDTLIKTMKLLGPAFRLVRVGPPLGVSGETDFGRIDQEKLNQIYNACDILLNTSIYEGFGYTNIEAMATDLPVVASDLDVYREVLGNGGVYAEPRNPYSFKEAVLSAVELRDELINAARLLAVNFKFELFIERMNKYYNSVREESLGESHSFK